jgi:hypothetical protein
MRGGGTYGPRRYAEVTRRLRQSVYRYSGVKEASERLLGGMACARRPSRSGTTERIVPMRGWGGIHSLRRHYPD